MRMFSVLESVQRIISQNITMDVVPVRPNTGLRTDQLIGVSVSVGRTRAGSEEYGSCRVGKKEVRRPMRCPHCGKWIAPEHSKHEEEAQRVMEWLKNISQPFRMNKQLQEAMSEDLDLSLIQVYRIWNNYLRLHRDLVEKVSGYGPTTRWRIKDP